MTKVYKVCVRGIEDKLWSWNANYDDFDREREVKSGEVVEYIPGKETLPGNDLEPLWAFTSLDFASEYASFSNTELWVAEADVAYKARQEGIVRCNSITLLHPYEPDQGSVRLDLNTD